MLEKIRGKINRKLLAASTAAVVTVAASAVPAFAEEGSSSTVSNVIQSAGTQLITEFTNLATAVIPVIISIAVVGLGIYSVVYLFNMAKKFFSKAAG